MSFSGGVSGWRVSSAITNSNSSRITAIEVVKRDDVCLSGAASRIHGKDDEIVGATGRNRYIEGEFGRIHGIGSTRCAEANTPVALHVD